jgi:phage-related protein
MANENDISGKVGLDYSGFQKGITALNQQIKNIEVSFRGSAATMDDWSSTSEGLNLRISTLNEKLTLQKAKLKALTDEFNYLNTAEGDHTKEQQQLAGQMASLEKQINSTQGQIKKYSAALGENKSAYDKLSTEIESQESRLESLKKQYASTVLEQGKSSKEAKTLKSEISSLSEQLGKNRTKLNDAEKGVKDFGGSAEDAGKKASVFGDVLKANFVTDAVKTGINAIGSAIKSLSAAFVSVVSDSVSAYSDYEQLTGGVETLFNDSADAVEEYAQSAYKTAGLSANDYMETVTSFSASLLQSLDGDTKAAAEAADTAVTDMSDNANKMGSDMSSIQNAYQGFAKQNYTMLDNLKLGYGGTKTEMERLLSDAEKLSGQEYDISNLNDVYEAIHVVQTEMGITGTTAEEAANTIAGSMNSVKSSWENVLTSLASGNDEQVKTAIDGLVESAINAATNIAAIVPTIIDGLGQIASAIIAELPKMVNLILPPLTDSILNLAQTLVSIVPQLAPVATDLVTQILNLIIDNLPLLASAAIQIVSQLGTSIIENLPLLVEAALDIILQLATSIADSLPELIPTIVNVVIQIVETLIDNVDMLVDAAIAIIIALANGLINALPTLIEKAPEIVLKLVVALIKNAPKLAAAAVEIIANLVSGLVDSLGAVVDAASEIADAIKKKITGLASEALQWGKDIINGIVDGIKSAASAVGDAVSGIAQDIRSFLHFSVPDVGPLTDYESWMPDFMQGLADGITANKYKVTDAMAALSGQLSATSSINLTANAMPAATQSSTQIAEGTVNGIASLLGGVQLGGGQYTINVVLPGVGTLASALFDPLQNVAVQKGVSFG